MQNKMEGQSTRIEQAEDRISKLKDEMKITGKTEDLLNNSRPVKRKCKNLLTPSKDQTGESWILKECIMYSTK
jgi:hypothetical protein